MKKQKKFLKSSNKYSLLILLIFLGMTPGLVYSQKFLKHSEIGFWLGGAHYMGDLNEDFRFFRVVRPAAGFLYQHNPHERWCWRSTLSAGRVYANDKFSPKSAYRSRNLHFRSDLIELSTQVVFNFLPYEIGKIQEGYIFPFSPYMFFGLGLFYANPQAEFQGNWVYLKKYDTEGQGTSSYGRKEYSIIQMSVPFGFGVKAGINQKWGIGFEWGFRRTFYDYLDDVSSTYPDKGNLLFERGEDAVALSDPSERAAPSTPDFSDDRFRGNPETRDWFSFFGVTLTRKIENKKARCPSTY